MVNFPVCLAPMVGLSHVALRLLVRRYLPLGARTIWPTEMLNSRRIPTEIMGETPETFISPEETDLVPQILGNEPEPIAVSVARLRAWGAVATDINMGCPVRKALRHNYGVALMGDPDYAAQVVSMAVKASDSPVSVKLRAGLQSDPSYLRDFCQGLEGAGAAWVCLHPRLASDKRRGRADWAQIGFVRDQLHIPVIGNGDVQTADDVFALGQASHCDMVMVGRALTGRPWLLWQVGERLGWPPPEGMEGRRAPDTPEAEAQEFYNGLIFFINALERFFSEGMGITRLNFFMRNSHPWLEFGHALAASLTRAATYAEARDRTHQFFSQPQRMSRETSLRY
jgi:tRNA-dihydrouridine synthase B